MPANNVEIGVDREWVDFPSGYTEERFYFVIRTTGPVRNWVRGCKSFPSRFEALQDFQDFCAAMGWVNMATEVPIDG